MFSFNSIKEYHAFLAANPSGCSIAVDHYLAKIRERIQLNAFLEVYADEAKERAAQLDADRVAGKKIGKLHGVVFSLKDVICFKDHTVCLLISQSFFLI